MRKTLLSAFILSLFLTGGVFAKESDYEKHIAKGIASSEQNNFTAAADEFNAALRESPGDRTATLYLGIVLSRSGSNDAGPLLRKALSMKPDDPRTNLELGIFYFNKAVYEEATDYFENTIRLAPGTDYAAKAGEYLKSAKGDAATKPLMASILAGVQYDSNVVLNPDDGFLPQGISRQSDWRTVINVKGRYNFVNEQSGSMYAGYGFYQNLHRKLSDYNVNQQLFELGGAYRLSRALALGGSYTYEYIFAGGEAYGAAHSLSPSLKISEGPGLATIVEYRYRKNHYMNDELFRDNADRSGTNHTVGILQEIKLGGAVRLRVAYAHDTDSTRKDFWDYRGDKGKIDIGFTLPQKLLLNLNGEYYKKQYKGFDPLAGVKRSDKTYTASVSLTKPLSDRFSVTVGELYIRNKSNVEFFDYKRSITSVFLNARF
ncbi:MAG: hypothetical protein ACYC69_09705 [Thermodesulfovibrionales bacterium]